MTRIFGQFFRWPSYCNRTNQKLPCIKIQAHFTQILLILQLNSWPVFLSNSQMALRNWRISPRTSRGLNWIYMFWSSLINWGSFVHSQFKFLPIFLALFFSTQAVDQNFTISYSHYSLLESNLHFSSSLTNLKYPLRVQSSELIEALLIHENPIEISLYSPFFVLETLSPP